MKRHWVRLLVVLVGVTSLSLACGGSSFTDGPADAMVLSPEAAIDSGMEVDGGACGPTKMVLTCDKHCGTFSGCDCGACKDGRTCSTENVCVGAPDDAASDVEVPDSGAPIDSGQIDSSVVDSSVTDSSTRDSSVGSTDSSVGKDAVGPPDSSTIKDSSITDSSTALDSSNPVEACVPDCTGLCGKVPLCGTTVMCNICANTEECNPNTHLCCTPKDACGAYKCGSVIDSCGVEQMCGLAPIPIMTGVGPCSIAGESSHVGCLAPCEGEAGTCVPTYLPGPNPPEPGESCSVATLPSNTWCCAAGGATPQ